jgi:dimethylargininase
VLIAVTRGVSPGILHCELTHLPRVEISFELTDEQHRGHQAALADLGCKVVALPADPDLPDSVFVEDTAIVLDEIAVLARPGVESRRPEVAGVARVLGQYRALTSIEPPGTLEGGDVLHVGKAIYVGASGRTNRSGIEQLRSLVAGSGYSVKATEVKGCLQLR